MWMGSKPYSSRKLSSVTLRAVSLLLLRSRTRVWGVMSWRLSRSPVAITHSQPSASHRRLMVPMRSSAS